MLDALLPLRCPGCGRPADPVCSACARALAPAPSAPAPPPLDAWVAAFAYRGVARELVARVKYRGARAALPWLARAVADVVAAEEWMGAGAVVTWAPTTPRRRRSRGFDPAELLARAVARRLGVPARALLARRPGPPQTGRPAAARRAGPRFVAPRPSPPRVLVVDDVATTGATLAAAAAALRAAGAGEVFAATAARTPPP